MNENEREEFESMIDRDEADWRYNNSVMNHDAVESDSDIDELYADYGSDCCG